MRDTGPITPTTLRKRQKRVRDDRREYHAKRRAALEACEKARTTRKMCDHMDAEDALHNACEARFWYRTALRELHAAESRPVEKGCHISERARDRMIRRGLYKPMGE